MFPFEKGFNFQPSESMADLLKFNEQLKKCEVPLEVIYDKAQQEAETEFCVFKLDLDQSIDRFPLSRFDIIKEVETDLRKSLVQELYAVMDKEFVVEYLTVCYGVTEDGESLLKDLRESFLFKWKIDYIHLVIANQLEQPKIQLKTVSSKEESGKIKQIKQEDSPRQKKQKTKVYHWNWDETQLLALYNALKSSEPRRVDCSKEEFKGIFGKGQFNGPVKWLTNNASELIFFIMELQSQTYLPEVFRQDWELLQICFVKADGSVFDANFKNLKTGIDTFLGPDTKKQIQNIIASIG